MFNPASLLSSGLGGSSSASASARGGDAFTGAFNVGKGSASGSGIDGMGTQSNAIDKVLPIIYIALAAGVLIKIMK